MIDEAPKPVSSPGSSDHLEVIKELGFKDQYFHSQSSLSLIFVAYQLSLLLSIYGRKLAARENLPRVGTSPRVIIGS